jgi:uroporphyrinogen-III synthase
MSARGAQVQHAEVYTPRGRVPFHGAQGRDRNLWRQGGISVYTATSVECLEALVGIVTPRCRELMHSTALVTGSNRVAEAAVALGIGSPICLQIRRTTPPWSGHSCAGEDRCLNEDREAGSPASRPAC